MKVERMVRNLGSVVVVVAALLLVSCGAGRIEDTAPINLVITQIQGIAGGEGEGEGEEASVLLSDVAPLFPDYAVVTLHNFGKDPRLLDDDAIDAGTYNNVLLERYEVHFFRTDGRNVEGQDVPYSFAGPLAMTVPFDATASVSFIVVRYQAKTEAPLQQLRWIGGVIGAGGEDIITAYAEITVHGRTLAGKGVRATGRLEVVFADYADPEDEDEEA